MRATFLACFVLPAAMISAGSCGGEAFTTKSNGDGDGDGDGSGGSVGSGGTQGSGGSGAAGSGAAGSGGSATGGRSALSTDCFSTYDCELIETSCCPSCDQPTIEDVLAIARGQEELVEQEFCGENPPPCVPCEPIRNPHLFAQCVEESCQAFDLREHEDAACGSSDDCIVIPAACCACGASNSVMDVVAIHRDSTDFQESQCETTPVCDDCAWTPPLGVSATCEDGFCALTLDGPVPN